MKSTSQKRIGVFGHYGNMNLGDEITFTATVQNIALHMPHAVIEGFTLNPSSTCLRNGIESFPIRSTTNPFGWLGPDCRADQRVEENAKPSPSAGLKDYLKKIPVIYHALRFGRDLCIAVLKLALELRFLWLAFRRLKTLDSLWIAGSNQIEDAHGTWGYPYTLFKWTLVARVAKTSVSFVSVGASPMTSRVSRFLCSKALDRAAYRSFRSSGSRTVVMAMKVKGKHEVYPDLAYSYRTCVAPIPSSSSMTSILVGINPMGYFDPRYWPVGNESIYREYVSKLSKFAAWLIRSGFRVMLFPTQLASDPLVIHDLTRQIQRGFPEVAEHLTKTEPIRTGDDLLRQINLAEITVVTRFHGVILSHLMHKPVIAISYEQKIDDAMAAMGHERYCLPIGDIDLELLKKRFLQLVENRVAIAGEIAAKLDCFQRQLDQQYDQLLTHF